MVWFARKLGLSWPTQPIIPKSSVFDELGIRLRNEKPFVQMDLKDINEIDAR